MKRHSQPTAKIVAKRHATDRTPSFSNCIRRFELSASPLGLPDSSTLYRRIVEATHEGVWIVDHDGVTVFVNRPMARLLGTTCASIIGKPAIQFVSSTDKRAVSEQWKMLFTKRSTLQSEVRLRSVRGEYTDVLITGTRFCDQRGRPIGLLGMVTNITARKAAEQALQQSESRLQLQIQRMPIPCILWSPGFRVLSWNPAAEQTFGFTAEEAAGKQPYDFIVPREAQAHVNKIWRRLLRGDETAHSVNANVTKLGRKLLCEWYNTPLRDSTGAIFGVMSMVQDVTDRLQIEQALRNSSKVLEIRVAERTHELQMTNQALGESEEKYRRLFETIADGAFVLDVKTHRFVEANETALHLYGYTRKEFLALPPSAIKAESDDEKVGLVMAGVARHVPLSYHRKKDGTIFPVEISSNSFALHGRMLVCEIVRDITAKRIAERTLAHREQELADFFADAPLGLMWVGTDGRIQRINQSELAMIGGSEQRTVGRAVLDFFEDLQSGRNLLERLDKGEIVRDFRSCFHGPNGCVVPVLIDANGLWDNGQLIRTRWFVRDVTRMLELEKEILGIIEREQRRLGQDLHDDLCQQLAGIEFLSQRLASALLASHASAGQQALEISRMVQRAMTQTRDLARGLTPVRFEALGLMDALRDLADRTAGVYGVRCRFECGQSVAVKDLTTAIHLYRIAQEAVGNALKHGKATVLELSLSRRGRSLFLSISDNGRGFAGQLAAGKGIGLQIMRYRAEVLGGRFWIEPGTDGGVRVSCRVGDALQKRKGNYGRRGRSVGGKTPAGAHYR